MDVEDLISSVYVPGGRDPATGLDCYGLLLEVFRRLGVGLPDVAADWSPTWADESPGDLVAQLHAPWSEVSRPYRAGDVVVIKWPSKDLPDHVGVLVDDRGTRMIHALLGTGTAVWKLSRVRQWVHGVYRHEALA